MGVYRDSQGGTPMAVVLFDEFPYVRVVGIKEILSDGRISANSGGIYNPFRIISREAGQELRERVLVITRDAARQRNAIADKALADLAEVLPWKNAITDHIAVELKKLKEK